MIVPRYRLLFWVAAVVLPFALLGALAPEAAPICILFVGVLGGARLPMPYLLAKSGGNRNRAFRPLPACRRPGRQTGGSHTERAAEPAICARCSGFAAGNFYRHGRAGYRPAEDSHGRGWFGLAFQAAGQLPHRFGIRRGASYLGFWSARKAFPVQSEIRVYPDLLKERKNLAALFLNRGSVGLHVQRQVGKGRDFEKLREYVPGDSFDDIHWKATARRGKPITKVFQIERTQEIYVVVDASRLSARQSILERFVTASLVLGLAANNKATCFGLLTFTDGVDTFVRARNGKTHYSGCRDALYTLQPQIVTPDFDELCTFIRLRLRRRALIGLPHFAGRSGAAENFVRNWI